MNHLEQLLDSITHVGSLLGIAGRIEQRMKRGEALHKWAVTPQLPQPGSPLAIADARFSEDISPALMSEIALFPAMNAAENLATAEYIIRGWNDSPKRRFSSLVTLTRAALESAARTVWVLSNTDPDVRHARCLSLAASELYEQSNYHTIELTAHDTGVQVMSPERHTSFQTHTDDVARRQQLVRALGPKRLPGYTSLVHEAAEWVGENTPVHDDNELSKVHFHTIAKGFYSIASSMVHGLQWAIEYVQDERDAYAMVADSLAAAVNMAEVAVALYEAQAQNPDSAEPRERLYPERLQPTITEWAARYR
ncbi:hypothetical protein [Rhodococcus sp. JS3073]|uniref:hypothetical protein n=1 Tax=Rhodococcus sp. JS3073 TaxID=3002901 RepID=UPI002286982C|nr:hypothetical protein [Rhodococcus sp. JS3073]WAM13943.1 hypothetical protein OYT95_31655 [Rhodococcus sp. JS3073]